MSSVAVLIPSYNQPHMLETALLSVIAQTYDNVRIIVVTVDKDEDTRSVLSEIGYLGPTMVWVQTDHPSVFGQLNKAVSEALSRSIDYMMFMGSDDFLLPNKIGQEVKVAGLRKAKLVYSPYFEGNDELNITRVVELPNVPSYELLLRQSFIPDMALCHRSVFEEFGLFDEKQGEQVAIYDKWLHVAEKYIDRIVFSPFPNYIYRRHSGQTSSRVPIRIEDRERVRTQSLERTKQWKQ